MKQFNKSLPLKYMTILIMSLLMALHVSSSVAGGYDNALKGVKGIDVVFDVSAGNPAFANIVFWAVRDTYKNEAVSSLPEKSQVAVVFHGKVVKLLSSDRTGFDEKENAEIDKFQATLREMAKLTGIDASNYSKMERGLLPMNELDYYKICKQLTN